MDNNKDIKDYIDSAVNLFEQEVDIMRDGLKALERCSLVDTIYLKNKVKILLEALEVQRKKNEDLERRLEILESR